MPSSTGSRGPRRDYAIERERFVEASWLFTRGCESVRLQRVARDHHEVRLTIDGPGDTQEHVDFVDVISCMAHQSEIERRLISQGFQLEDFVYRNGLDLRVSSLATNRRR
jgi:hypothetical protein